MKKLFLMILALGLASSLPAQTLPDVGIENQSGETVSTKSLIGGKPMIISFWSTTCKPCIMELNAINEQLEEWREEADFEVVAISTDDSRSVGRARAMTRGNGWEFICLYDKNQEFKRAMQVSLTPHTFVVDADGKIVYSHSGYTLGSEAELFEKIKSLGKQ